MKEVELVIKIPEEIYKRILPYRDFPIISNLANDYHELTHAVANGVLLPKGHGDLKDMSNLPYIFDLTREDSIYSGKDIERAIKSMKTIIEADRSEEDG